MEKALEIFNEIWQVELYRGAILAVGVFFAVLLFYWILKLIIFCKFGCRRCSKVVVPLKNGDIVVAANAISAAISSELKTFPELEVRRVSLFRKRAVYFVELRTTLVKSENGRGLPELYSVIEPLVKRRIAEIFGITNLSKVIIRVDQSANFDDEDDFDNEQIVTPGLPDFSAK